MPRNLLSAHVPAKLRQSCVLRSAGCSTWSVGLQKWRRQHKSREHSAKVVSCNSETYILIPHPRTPAPQAVRRLLGQGMPAIALHPNANSLYCYNPCSLVPRPYCPPSPARTHRSHLDVFSPRPPLVSVATQRSRLYLPDTLVGCFTPLPACPAPFPESSTT